MDCVTIPDGDRTEGNSELAERPVDVVGDTKVVVELFVDEVDAEDRGISLWVALPGNGDWGAGRDVAGNIEDNLGGDQADEEGEDGEGVLHLGKD